MFYRKKYYIVHNDFVSVFNKHFNETNLPNQISHGSRLVGRWMKKIDDATTEIFAIWEYDSYEDYVTIESRIHEDTVHVQKINAWYEQHGGRAHVLKNYILEVRNDALVSTI